MFSQFEPTIELAARAAVTAMLTCRATGGTQRDAFEAALEAWCEFRPEDGEIEAHEAVVPLVLAMQDRTYLFTQ
jgi:hypothetical protein